MSLVSIENELIVSLKAAFQQGSNSLLKTVGSLPGEFDEDTVGLMLTQAPAVYILFIGADRHQGQQLNLKSHWALYSVTSQAGSNKNRRYGQGSQIGSYEIIERALPALEATQPTNCGAISISAVSNLYTGRLQKRGISAYAATFDFNMPLESFRDASNDGQFITYHSDYLKEAESLPVAGDHPQAHLTLEQS